jgi:hypothetical protein
MRLHRLFLPVGFLWVASNATPASAAEPATGGATGPVPTAATGQNIDREIPPPAPKRARQAPSMSVVPAPRPQTNAFYAIIGTSVNLGVEVVHRFGSFFELSAGGGMSLFDGTESASKSPFTWSAMPRLRVGGATWAFTAGVGLSGGPAVHKTSCGWDDDGCQVVVERAGYLTRANVELGAEMWARSGFALRMFAGYGYVLDPEDFRCVGDAPTCPAASASTLYTGLGLGYAF